MSIILCLCLLSYPPYFLILYPGGQQSAMGGANVAIAEDAFGIFYNPGGLAFQKSLDIGFESHSIPELDKPTYWATSLNLPLNNNLIFGVYGTGIRATYTSWLDENMLWKAFSSGFSLSYRVKDFIGIGIGIKYIHSAFVDIGGWYDYADVGRSASVDVGGLAYHKILRGKAGIGLAIQNIGPKLSYPYEYRDALPLNIRAGVSYGVSAQDLFNCKADNWLSVWFYEKWRVLVAYDINKITPEYAYGAFEKIWHSFGVELRPIPIFAFRFGYFDDCNTEPYDYDQRKDWTVGFGIDLKYLRLDVSNDAAFYYLQSDKWKITVSLNLGEPIFPKDGLLGVLSK